MDLREMRTKLMDYCNSHSLCEECKLTTGGWDSPLTPSKVDSCLCIGAASERDLERALKIIEEDSDYIKPTEDDETKPNDDVIKPEGSINPNAVPVDLVNHPPHYTHGMECIEEMILIFGREAVMNFCLCNAWKYRKRAAFKGTPEQDMDKSDWYINKYKELALQKEHDYGWEFK